MFFTYHTRIFNFLVFFFLLSKYFQHISIIFNFTIVLYFFFLSSLKTIIKYICFWCFAVADPLGQSFSILYNCRSPMYFLGYTTPDTRQWLITIICGGWGVCNGWIGGYLGFSIQAWKIIKPNHTNPLVGDLDCQFEPKPFGAFGHLS